MAVNPRSFLAFAKDCLSRDDEIGYRNAAARAYYAAYHKVSQQLTNPPEQHSSMIKYLTGSCGNRNENIDDLTLRHLGRLLRTMKVIRQIADYKLHREVTLQDAQGCICNAEQAMTMARQSSKLPQ